MKVSGIDRLLFFLISNKFKSGLFLSSRCSKKQSNAEKNIYQYFKVMIKNEKDLT